MPSNSQNDYTPNLNAEVSKGCDTIIAVGGLMADDVKTVAQGATRRSTSPRSTRRPAGPNVYGMQFNTAQGGFLGGYLAAGIRKTGKVATYGGLNIPPVTIYMDGFWEGVQYYNQQKGKNVKVLGWDEKNQKGGTFAGSRSPTRTRASRSARRSSQQGADVIFPVAGGTGLGAGAAAQASGGKAERRSGSTPTAACRAAQYCSVFLTSVIKNLDRRGAARTSTKAAGGQVPDRPLHRHAGEQRHRPRAVPRLRLQGPARTCKTELDDGQGGHHQPARSRSPRRSQPK